MKKLIFVLSFISVASVSAQDLENYIKILRSDLNTQKVNLITFNMMFTEEESEIFWKIYEEYEAKLDKLEDARLKLINDFSRNYLNMTDEKAEQIIDKIFEYRQNRLNLKKELWDTLKNKIPPTKAAKFIQLENHIQSLIDLKINAELPLIEKTAIDK